MDYNNYGNFVTIRRGKIKKFDNKSLQKKQKVTNASHQQGAASVSYSDAKHAQANQASFDFIPTEKTKATNRKKKHVKFPISAKLIGIISAIVILSLGSITFLVSYFVSADTRVNAEDNNFTINTRTANDCETRFNSLISLCGTFFDMLESAGANPDLQNETSVNFFERNAHIAAVHFEGKEKSFINTSYFLLHEMDTASFEDYTDSNRSYIEGASNGIVKADNASPFFQSPCIALFVPVASHTKNDVAVILFSSEDLMENFSNSSVNASFLVNDEGNVLVHSDVETMMNAENLKSHHIVEEMFTSQNSNMQLSYFDEENVEYYGAFRKLRSVNCGVITEVKSAIILEAVRATTRRNVYLTVAILCLCIILIRFFAKAISTPLRKLTAVADEIKQGNFNTELFDELTEKRNDEIGVLIESTKDERQILNTISALTNKGVAKAIVRKEIDFVPHLKDITIFFSDIRGFTAISDGFNNRFGKESAAEIIGFLNDYMSRMVNCITISGGNVDKFEGDAIMACWGVLRDDSLAFETMSDDNPEKARLQKLHALHVKQDAVNAIRGTIAMRYALMKYNKDAEIFTKEHLGEPLAKYKPHIRVGCGLNSGRATVGFMGSSAKMEFTSIGDAVNLASRTESSNKPCGTDILITEDTYNLLKNDYIKNPANNYTLPADCQKDEIVVEMIPVTFEVKGKGKQHFYAVVNMPYFNIEEFFRQGDKNFVVDPDCIRAVGPQGPKSMAEVRLLLGIPTPDFSGVNLDKEESKVKAN
ncbi:MAG: HAMP domain-containing protein [Treponema sp.]|nr:HAMP domain-containing protein [Treponema sp.]